MDKGDKSKPAHLRHNRVAEMGKGEAIDNRTGTFGEPGERRTAGVRILRRKLDDPHQPAARPQALDNMPLE
jgi:hypothetical protein